jgi:hypothetical protein
MKSSSILLLAALGSGVATGWASTPADAGPAAAKSATSRTSFRTMSVVLSCNGDGIIGTINCWAYTSGGSGSYTYTWWGATEHTNLGDESRAEAPCPTSSPYTTKVTVWVSDNFYSRFAFAEKVVGCPIE